jgi:crotonobetainyl-CoA:carnitine CoA-transferase CaiB-like acyl-CoA transferase
MLPEIPRCARDVKDPTRVLDLSSLWAGPLCSHLLHRCGAQVTKVESTTRPDGARRGAPEFFDALNAGKQQVALDFGTREGHAQLRALIDSADIVIDGSPADIVIEGSRPRALRQLGIDAEALVRERPALTWISITAYGRGEPQQNWAGYGDDAGVAAGLSELMFEATGERCFVGDAIADPLTGLHAARAAWSGWRAGGGGLVALSLAGVVQHCVAKPG